MPVPASQSSSTLLDILDRVLDKGLVINADIVVSLVGTELLGIRLRAALASFETAVKYGLEFPGGTKLDLALLDEAKTGFETCPQCGKTASRRELLDVGCPWCGWMSARAQSMQKFLP
jgi:ribosomal protein L37AE/L43A